MNSAFWERGEHNKSNQLKHFHIHGETCTCLGQKSIPVDTKNLHDRKQLGTVKCGTGFLCFLCDYGWGSSYILLSNENIVHLKWGKLHNSETNEPISVVLLFRNTNAANQSQKTEGLRCFLQKHRKKRLPTGFVVGSYNSTRLVFLFTSII